MSFTKRGSTRVRTDFSGTDGKIGVLVWACCVYVACEISVLSDTQEQVARAGDTDLNIISIWIALHNKTNKLDCQGRKSMKYWGHGYIYRLGKGRVQGVK